MQPLTLSAAKKVIDSLRNKLLSKPSPDECRILGMSLGRIEEIVSKVDRSKGGTPILDALTKEYSRQETEAKSTTIKPMPTKPAAPSATTATAKPAPRPAVNSNASLAAAILDEQDRRAAAALLKTRAEFSKLTPREASAFCRAGGKITA